jgi:hypothetical protein
VKCKHQPNFATCLYDKNTSFLALLTSLPFRAALGSFKFAWNVNRSHACHPRSHARMAVKT